MLRCKSRTPLIFAALLSAGMATAAEPQVTAIKCGRLIDVEKGTVVRNAVVLVEGTRIRAVGADVAIPAEARVVDLGQATVLPGLIDVHTHLLTRFPPSLENDQDSALLEYTQMDTAKRALLGAAQAREMLEAGFTTVRDVGNAGLNGDVALRDAIRAGWVPGPRMLVSTRALSPIGGQFFRLSGPGKELVRQEFVEVTGSEGARRAVRQAVFDGADVIKVIVHSALTLSPEEMRAIVDEAHLQGRKVAAHATGDAGTRLAAQAGVDSIEHAFEVPDDVLRLMAEKRIFLVPTDLPLDDLLSFPSPPGETGEQAKQRREGYEAYVDQHRERLARALRLGVPVAVGSDGYYAIPGKTRGQASHSALRALAVAGMKPLEILQAATIRAAELLGFPERFGSLAPGKSADLIAVPGNPLEDITALEDVRFVMKTGQIAKDETTGR